MWGAMAAEDSGAAVELSDRPAIERSASRTVPYRGVPPVRAVLAGKPRDGTAAAER